MFDNSRVGLQDGESVAAPIPQVIGYVQTAIGSSTLTRASGITARVKVGDPVCQGDAIETGADARVGIHFIDGTAFNLFSSANMVLNEFVCGSTGAFHSALLNVTEGPSLSLPAR